MVLELDVNRDRAISVIQGTGGGDIGLIAAGGATHEAVDHLTCVISHVNRGVKRGVRVSPGPVVAQQDELGCYRITGVDGRACRIEYSLSMGWPVKVHERKCQAFD